MVGSKVGIEFLHPPNAFPLLEGACDLYSTWGIVKIMVPFWVILGVYWGYIGVIWGIMEKKMETTTMGSMGDCQNYGPFLGPLT